MLDISQSRRGEMAIPDTERLDPRAFNTTSEEASVYREQCMQKESFWDSNWS
jgi:hypothetical protein